MSRRLYRGPAPAPDRRVLWGAMDAAQLTRELLLISDEARRELAIERAGLLELDGMPREDATRKALGMYG